jgi:hypothetical protein
MSHLIDLTGQRFGRLLVQARAPNRRVRQPYWTCHCTCGAVVDVQGNHLRKGRTTSCGCWHREQIGRIARTHGRSQSPEYGVWSSMKGRCTNPRDQRFEYYGGRGITVDPRWQQSFANFLADMGPRPAGHSIDRIDPDGPYAPHNCRWATHDEQMKNTRRSRAKRQRLQCQN